MSELYARLTCDVNPVGWKAPTAFARRGAGRVGVGTAPSVEVEAYKSALREALIPQWGDRPAIEQPCRIDLFFRRQLITYVSASGRNVTKHRADLTNMRKSTEDCLQPWLVKNDVLVVQGWTEIIEQSKTAEPEVTIEVYLL